MPAVAVVHRDDEYDSRGFSLLRDIQSRHFWYRGRHRLLLGALKQHLREAFPKGNALAAIDLGSGCGGWISCLQRHLPNRFTELALSDSSLHALELASSVVGEDVVRYQTDLLLLGWRNRWDIAFLLDVLEHIPDDAEVLFQIRQALKPGGLLFVTTPALRYFWSYNDEIVHHLRRYAKRDLARLAQASGLRLLRASYFMFFLSPLLWLSRLKRRGDPCLPKSHSTGIPCLVRNWNTSFAVEGHRRGSDWNSRKSRAGQSLRPRWHPPPSPPGFLESMA